MNRLLTGICVAVVAACTRSSPPPAPPPDVLADELEPFADAGASPELLHYLRELAKARAGEAADLDGDGGRETTAIALEDRLRWETNTRMIPGQPDVVIEVYSAGGSYTAVDSNQDSHPEWVETVSADGKLVTLLFDENSRGVANRRETQLTSADGRQVTVRNEVLDGGSFVPDSEFTRSNVLAGAAYDACAAHNFDLDNFPSVATPEQTLVGVEAPDFGTGHVPVNVISGDATSGYSCRHRMSALMKAFDCALGKEKNRGLDCLRQTNAALATRLSSILINASITVGCGLYCPGVVAVTDKVYQEGAGWPSRYRININPTDFDKSIPEDQCNTVLHELLHVARATSGPGHSDGDPRDQVFACANFCSGCSSSGDASLAGGAHADCARCAGSNRERAACGVQRKLEDIPCTSPGVPPSICHGGLANLNCVQCGGAVDVDCAGAEFDPPVRLFNCCKMCPPAQPMNDRVCPGPFGPSDAACKTDMPMCK